jgi:hypothetical protein
MLFRLRKYIAVFALATFLFPMVVEAVHTFEHRNDQHCTEKTSKHFHEAEHHCTICDFVPAISDHQDTCDNITSVVVYTTIAFSFYQSFAGTTPHFFYSLRGPPAVS